MPELAEIARHDEVVVLRHRLRVAEERAERIVGRRRHRSAHVVRVGHALVNDPAGCDVREIRPLALAGEDAAAAARRRPLRGGRALRAVGHRHTILPLSGAEVRGRERGGALGVAAVDHDRGERQALAHRGARAVDAVEGDAAAAQGERRAGALVEKIPRKDEVEVALAQCGLFKRVEKRAALHGALTFFPCFFAEKVVFAQLVEIVAQRALAFKAPADGGKREHGGGIAQAARLRAGHAGHGSHPF